MNPDPPADLDLHFSKMDKSGLTQVKINLLLRIYRIWTNQSEQKSVNPGAQGQSDLDIHCLSYHHIHSLPKYSDRKTCTV